MKKYIIHQFEKRRTKKIKTYVFLDKNNLKVVANKTHGCKKYKKNEQIETIRVYILKDKIFGVAIYMKCW